MSRYLLLTLLAGALAFSLAGCDADPIIDDEPALLGLELDGRLGATPLPGSARTVAQNGLTLHLTTARLYVSNVVLEREDGTEIVVNAAQPITLPARTAEGDEVAHTANESVHWGRLDAAYETVTLNEVPAGRYRAVRYDVGVRGLTNRVDATQAPANHPLARQLDVNNHWSWNTGYMFIRMDGRLDLNGDGSPDDAPEATVALHVGSDANLRSVRHEQAFTLAPGQRQHLHLIVDFAALIAGVDLSDPTQRRWSENAAVPPAVADRVGQAFAFDGVRTP